LTENVKVKIAWVNHADLASPIFVVKMPFPCALPDSLGFQVLWNCYYSWEEQRIKPLPIPWNEEPILVMDYTLSGVRYLECDVEKLPRAIWLLKTFCEPQMIEKL